MYFPSRPPPPVLGSPCSAVMADADAEEEMCPAAVFTLPSSEFQCSDWSRWRWAARAWAAYYYMLTFLEWWFEVIYLTVWPRVHPNWHNWDSGHFYKYTEHSLVSIIRLMTRLRVFTEYPPVSVVNSSRCTMNIISFLFITEIFNLKKSFLHYKLSKQIIDFIWSSKLSCIENTSLQYLHW